MLGFKKHLNFAIESIKIDERTPKTVIFNKILF